ncbi:MAG: type II CRISPR-associated endonuclease Cas1 [Ignavibacteria bacterium]|nr:type II CRISPR-associated endonuclease Cas1 [Ignavibacteria bacterium]
MLKRTIIIQSNIFISTRNEQLVLKNREQDVESSIPIEDIGLLEIDSLQVTITAAAISKLAESGATVLFTDSTHHPVGMITPIVGNTLHAERIRLQVAASRPTEKRSWQHTVKCKIMNQATLLEELGLPFASVRSKAAKVLSNDSTNREAVAASVYWKELLRPFGCGRDPEGPYPNNYLNYGYAILRACVARALVSSGLHPALGIKHSNKYNAFALADDIMEPYRPFVDRVVFNIASANEPSLTITPDVKKQLLSVLTHDTFWDDMRRPLMNSVALSAASLVHTLAGTKQVPEFPRLCE